MMRALVVALAVLAAAKIVNHERLYRQGVEEALVLAYRDRAMAACQSQEPALVAAAAGAPLWTQPTSLSVAIGRSDVDVQLWQIDDARWPARFKHPHLVLETGPNDVCEFDVVEGRAYLRRL